MSVDHEDATSLLLDDRKNERLCSSLEVIWEISIRLLKIVRLNDRLAMKAWLTSLIFLVMSATAHGACDPGAGHSERPDLLCAADGSGWVPSPGFTWSFHEDPRDLSVRPLIVGERHYNDPNWVWDGSDWQPVSTTDDQGNTVLVVGNRTDNYITVSVDGVYGCNTASYTTCTIPITVGNHNLHAVKTENGASVEIDLFIDSTGFRWTISESQSAPAGQRQLIQQGLSGAN